MMLCHHPNKKKDIATDKSEAFKVTKFVSNSFIYFPATFKSNDVRNGISNTPKIKISKVIPSKNSTYQQMLILVF